MKKTKKFLKLKGKTAVFIDYANLKAWARDKKLFLDLKVLYEALAANDVGKVFFYYGTDPKSPASFAFFNKLRTLGYEVITKPVKYFKISLLQLLEKRVNQEWVRRLSLKTKMALHTEVKKLEKNGVKLLSPKANFDVEITLDMILFADELANFILFSGDGDFASIVRYLRSKGKKVLVISGRKFLAGELLEAASQFITLERFSAKVKGFLKKARPLKERS